MSILDELTRAVDELRERNTQGRQYTGEDEFRANGQAVFTVQEFWQYMYSQLGSCTADLAEFFVSRALDILRPENMDYWSAYDISYRGRRIEVKETRYIHPWNRNKVSDIRTFSIAPSNNDYWTGILNLNNGKKSARQSDVYVFCLNTNRDIDHQDHLNLDYWEFYIVPTFMIDSYAEHNHNPDQKKISLGVVRKLSGGAVKYDGIRAAVDEALIKVDQYLIDRYS